MIENQRNHAQVLFDHYEFQDSVEDQNGWTHDCPDLLEKLVFLQNPNGGNSIAHLFYVEFVPGTADVKQYGVR